MKGQHTTKQREVRCAIESRIGPIIERAIRDQVFPGCVLGVWSRSIGPLYLSWGHATYDENAPEVGPETLYDLASLTKALVTAPLYLALFEREILSPQTTLEECIVGSIHCPKEKQGITLYHLLHHRGGLLPWLPLHEVGASGRQAVVQAILKAPLQHPPGTFTEYSDLGFILLGFIAEHILNQYLDELFIEQILVPLAMKDTTHLTFNPHFYDLIAPSTYYKEGKSPFGGAVNDLNCRAMGGVAGHAGLFGSVRGVMELLIAMLFTEKLFKEYHPQRLIKGHLNQRFCFGFDTPDGHGSQAGSLFSHQTIGHLGYTGTSFWADLVQGIVVIFLANRTYPNDSTYSKSRIKTLRPKLHDEIMKVLGDYAS